MEPRATISAIWEHFTTSPTEGTVSYKLCKATISRGRNVKHLTTSVMHNHMHLKHPFETMSAQTPPARVYTQPQPPIMSNPKPPYHHNHLTAKQITETLGEMICQDLAFRFGNCHCTMLQGALRQAFLRYICTKPVQ